MAAENRTPTKNPRHKLSEKCWIMNYRKLPSYGSSVTWKYKEMKSQIRQQKKDISTIERISKREAKDAKTETL
jgi:hypothetical protein